MSYQVLISEAAENDIKVAYEWYEENKVLLGKSFKSTISQSIDSIQENPHKFPIKFSNVHVCFILKYPFGIHYIIKKSTIIFIGVFHTSMNPTKWKARKKGF